MATQRTRGSAEQKENGTATTSKDKADRLSKKAKIIKEQQQRSAKLRWAVIVVLLVVAVVGLYYYTQYYQSADTSKPSKKQNNPESSAPPKKEKKKQKQKEGKGTSKTQGKTKEKVQGKEKGKKKGKKAPPMTQEDIERQERIEKLNKRVLRQPVPPADPDRPHVLDIINADNLLVDGKLQDALERFNAILSLFPQSARAQFGKGLTLIRMAREKRSNKLMDTAIDFFYKAGMESTIASEPVQLAALLAMVDHAQERGKFDLAIEGMEKLVELHEDKMLYANQLGMLYLRKGSKAKAKTQFKKSMAGFEDNHFAQAQLGYILYSDKKYEQALPMMMDGIRHSKEIRENGNFYNYAGDTLTRLNRSQEALVLYGEAVGLGVFPSVWQRSLLNEPDLTASPWWSPQDTGYMSDFERIEKLMDTIASEVRGIFDAEKMVFMDSSLRETPHYSLFSKGKKNLKNCLKTRETCALLETFPEAASCKRGTIKFSTMPPHTHIAPHVGVTNTILQIVVGLDMDSEIGMQVRVGDEQKVLGNGQIGVLDESFEKEVWYDGELPALYLTIDAWHPDLSHQRRRQLGPL